MCGRYIKGHMKLHSEQHTHPLVLSFSDLSVWCYGCESYIDAPVSFPVHSNYTCLKVCFCLGAARVKECSPLGQVWNREAVDVRWNRDGVILIHTQANPTDPNQNNPCAPKLTIHTIPLYMC